MSNRQAPGHSVSRRAFVRRGFGTALAAMGCFAWRTPVRIPERRRPTHPSFFDDPAAITHLGHRAVAEGHAGFVVAPTDAATLRGAIARDLVNEDFVVVGGWLLARAEVEACVAEVERSRRS